MSRQNDWEELYKRFDPFKPALQHGWRADRVRSPARTIIADFAIPFGVPRALITGTVGTGKSTELLRIGDALSNKHTVVLLDLHRHFADVVRDESALERVTSWEVVFLATLALVAVVNERLPYQIPPAHLTQLQLAWNKLAKATDPPPVEVDMAILAKSMLVRMCNPCWRLPTLSSAMRSNRANLSC